MLCAFLVSLQILFVQLFLEKGHLPILTSVKFHNFSHLSLQLQKVSSKFLPSFPYFFFNQGSRPFEFKKKIKIYVMGSKKKRLLAGVGRNIARGAGAPEIGQNYKWHCYRSCHHDFLIEKCVFLSSGNGVVALPTAV